MLVYSPVSRRPGGKTKRTRKHSISGVFYRNYPRSTRWKVDQDYLSKLSREELEWLAAFNDRWVSANFSYTEPEGFPEWGQDERRAAYTAVNAANADIYGKCPDELIQRETWTMVEIEGPDTHAQTALPHASSDTTSEYLNSPTYKTARDSFRAHLCQKRLEISPKITPAYERAKETLERIVRRGTSQEAAEPDSDIDGE
jgi:hypothetical protein